jgi:hypothetical protein
MNRAEKWRFHPRRKRRAPLLGRLLRRCLGVEQLCDECSRPYLEKPAALPVEQFVSGSAVASVFVEQNFGRKNFYVQLGRNATNGQQLFISQVLSPEHLKDAAQVALLARDYIREQKPLRLVSRR